jgi:DNA-binding XRE family transcriptional regulator/quercetin dioxygenase-like cupin family protein
VVSKRPRARPAAAPQSPALIGKRLKAIRRRAGITLHDLAAATGLNKGYLSRIESGEKSPSIATLLKLGAALKVPTSRLFGEEVADDDIHLYRGGKAAGKTARNPPRLVGLSGNVASSTLSTFLLRPAGSFQDETRAEHSGTEGAYVLDGSVELQFSDRIVALSAGDYIQFPGHLTHQVRRTSPRATVLVVVSDG